jgi:probable HAF family extracellular repeat protein
MRIVLMLAALTYVAAACARLDSPSSKYVIQQASVTELGTLGGQQSAALDVNDAGTIVGWSATAQGLKRAFRFSGSMMEELLSAFAGSAVPMEAASINSDGAIAGHFVNALGQNRGLAWDAGVNNAFPLQAGFGSGCSHHSQAFAINDAGHVAGHRIFCDDVSYSQATLWTTTSLNFQLEAESLLHLSSVAYDINLHDFVVGRSDDFDVMFRWKWVTGQPVQLQRVPPPAFGAGVTYGASTNSSEAATGINDAGAVVGYTQRVVNRRVESIRAFFWDGSSVRSEDLGVLPGGINSHAEDINESRMIAGHADVRIRRPPPFTDIFRELAFLYHGDFGMYALPTPSFTGILGSCRAYALNEPQRKWPYYLDYLVQVVGSCESATGMRAVRWDVVLARLPVRLIFGA